MASNIGSLFLYNDVSYLAGWLGDAVYRYTDNTTHMDNRDYCADLDAEISYRYIVMGCSALDVLSYYFFPITNSMNRAALFSEYIEYDVVCQKVFEEIDRDESKDEDWDEVHTLYPDTYDFLKSLENQLSTRGDY